MSETQLRDEATESDSDETELTRDDVFHVLQCRRRRLVLKYLQEYDGDGPARMGDITEHIAALEHDTTIDALRSQQRQRVYIALYQSHLTKMDQAGVLDYNQNRGYVETTDLTDRFDPYLDNEPSLLEVDADDATDIEEPTSAGEVSSDASADVDRSWYKGYLYAAAGSLFLAATLSSGFLSASLPPESIAILISLLFTVLAVSHWMTESSWSDTALGLLNGSNRTN